MAARGDAREVPEGYMRNPATGRLIKTDGPTARKIRATRNNEQLAPAQISIGEGATERVVPARPEVAGSLARARALPAEAGAVYEAGEPRAHGQYKVLTMHVAREPETMEQFAKTMWNAIEKALGERNLPREAHRNLILNFEAGDGQEKHRTVNFEGWRVKGPRNILDLIMRMDDPTGIEGSDAVGGGYALDTSSFGIGFVEAPAGGASPSFKGISCTKGEPHAFLKLIDFGGKAADNDCLLAVLRAVAKGYGLPVPTVRNKTLREKLALGEGPIKAEKEALDRLADEFGLRIRVLLDPVYVAQPESERVYDDDPAREHEPNRCVGAEPQLNIVAESDEDPARPECKVYLRNGHYEYVDDVFAPPKVCRITGDIIKLNREGNDARTKKQIKERVLSQTDPATGRQREWLGGAEAAPHRKPSAYKQKCIVYDFETVYDPATGVLQPYALGWLEFDPAEVIAAGRAKQAALPEGSPEQYFEADFAHHVDRVREKRTVDKPYKVAEGLFQFLADAPDDVQYTLISFNGCRFDHYILAALANDRVSLNRVFATSAGLRTLSLGRHTTLDLAKLLPAMSLADACASFRTKPEKQEGFSHRLPQKAFEEGRLGGWMAENSAALSEYLARDVCSTASLFMHLKRELEGLSNTPLLGPKAGQTAGAHAWNLMSATCKLPKAVSSQELDKIIRSAVVGGRTQVYRPAPLAVEGELRMVDFTSLYPTAMSAAPKCAALFPKAWRWGCYPQADHSEPEAVTEYQHGEVGLYEISVTRQPSPAVLPRRGEDGSLDWSKETGTPENPLRAWATQIDIELIRHYGGELAVIRGYVWRGCVEGLFRPYVSKVARIKNEQDTLKKAKDPRYNPALRECAKLLLNSASGKLIQRNFEEVVELARNSHEQRKAESKMDQGRRPSYIPLGDERTLVCGYRKAEKVYDPKRAKPSIAAVLVYAYSRALLYHTLLKDGRCLYSDTDSALLTREDYEAMRVEFPTLNPEGREKEFGDLEQELPPHEYAEAYLLAPKDYGVLCWPTRKGAEAGEPYHKGSKLRIKGINQRRDRLVRAGRENEVRELVADAAATGEEYATGMLGLTDPVEDPRIMHALLKRRAAGEKGVVLCGQLTRSWKVGYERGGFELRQRFLVKEV